MTRSTKAGSLDARVLGVLLTFLPVGWGCSGDGQGVGVDAGGSVDGASPQPVTIQNLSARVEGTNTLCATNGSTVSVSCPDYYFRFVLRNDSDKPIAIVDNLRLAFGSEELYNRTAGICTLEPWTVSPGMESELITVHFTYTRESATDGDFRPRFYYDCAGAWTRTYAPGPYELGDTMPPLPTSGIVTLKVQGILSDGSEFLAEAPTVLNP